MGLGLKNLSSPCGSRPPAVEDQRRTLFGLQVWPFAVGHGRGWADVQSVDQTYSRYLVLDSAERRDGEY